MYNIYVAEKRQKDLDEKEKTRKIFSKYRIKFKSKKIYLILNKYNNLNSPYQI